MVAAGFMLALNGGKLGANNQNCPEDGEDSQRQVRLHHAQRFRAQVRVIKVLRLQGIDLRGTQFHSRKNECRADQDTGDGAERIERLREVKPSFRALRVTQLRDERVRSRFQKRQSAGDDKEGEQEKNIASRQRGRPEQECAQAE